MRDGFIPFGDELADVTDELIRDVGKLVEARTSSPPHATSSFRTTQRVDARQLFQ
jgi:hypothetical protein